MRGPDSPTSFAINGYGYVGSGWAGISGATDLWRYDPGLNTWTPMATFPGTGWYDAECFVLGHKCWVICGSHGGPPYDQSVWMYDANQNTWTKKNNYPGGKQEGLLTFSIGNHGYAGCGWDGGSMHNDFWEYDTTNDTWTSCAPFPARGAGLSGIPRGFVIGSKAYVCTGDDATWNAIPTGWAYDTVTKAWCAFSHEGPISRSYAVSFVINNKGYMGLGCDTNAIYTGPYNNNYYEWDPTSTFTYKDTSSCGADTVKFSGITSFDTTEAAVTWNWTFIGGSPGVSNSQYPDIIYSAPGTYLVKLIVSTCAGSDTVTKNITITGGFNIPIILKGNTAICTGQNDTLTASGGTSYIWSNGATTSSIIVSPLSNTTYTVEVHNGACKKDTTISVAVGAKLPITITGPVRVCAGTPVTLTSSGGAGYTYLWNNGATTSTVTVTPLFNTTYSVAVSNGFCNGDTSWSIIVLPAPVVTLSATSTSICAGDNATITATGGGTYLWSTGSTNAVINVTPLVTTTYSLSVSNGTCNTDTAITITVNTKPVAVISGNATICFGTGITLTVSGAERYVWSPDSGISCDTCSVVFTDPKKTTTYTVIAYNGPCADTITSKVKVDPAPKGGACCNDSISLGDTATIKAVGTGIQTYVWIPGMSITCDTCAVTKVFPQFTTTYTVVMTDSDGCSKTDSVRIFVSECSTIWIPNAFTPNGDERNNVFAPKGVCILSYSMQIFDRWGELLYTTNDSKPWDGKVRGGGNVVQEDTYIYLITATDGFLKQTKYLWAGLP